ncbi:MAG: GatB/YqeY domain-containing protein [Geobacteraceae bacterium]|nr:GatB/YqeY domain-containing protein [Geobacteraceae bacterium]
MLIEKIREDRLKAMKAKDEKKKNLLGVLIADSSKDVKQPDDATVIRFVKKFIENARDNLQMLEKAGGSSTSREDAQREIDVLMEYLPSQLTGDSLAEAINKVMALEAIEPFPANMGKVMKALGMHHAGRYDGKEASELVKSILSGKISL